MPSSDSSHDVALERLAAEFVERHRRGEHPSLAEYAARYPHLADDIRELFPALIRIESLKPVAGDFVAPGGAAAPRLERLGDYRILREVGRGGMGVVYEAEQESLGRHVALKVLPAQALLNGTYLERFRREARAAARLHHTNIVPVFGVGEADGIPYYAMQFIRGEGLDKVLADLRRFGAGDAAAAPDGSTAHGLLSGRFAAPQPAGDAAGPADAGPPSALSGSPTSSEYHRSVARVGVQVAEALAHAHARGVLHRDVKPSNLLLDRQGRVWITDFGLAKAEGADELTHTGDIVGTLRFMAPERFDGHSLPQSDVYGLGLTLYELLTLRPAFDDGNKARLVKQVLHQPPAPPRKIDPRVPRDLETVVLKCIAKDPAERYASAEAVAEDLRRFLTDRPLRARRSSAAERLGRWCRRNRWVAGLGAAVLLLLTVTAVGGVALSLRLDASLRAARDAEREGKRQLFESYVSDADATRLSHRPGQRFGTLRRVRAALDVGRDIGLGDEDRLRLRNVAVAALCLPDVETGPELAANPDEPPPEGLDPVFRRRLLIDRALSRLPPPAFVLRGDSWYSPDGRFVAVATEEYVKRVCVPARVWRIDGPNPVRVLDDEGPFEEATTFNPDGRQVAFGHEDGTVRVYDTETGHAIRDLPPGSGAANCLAYHPTLPRLAVACNSEVAIWDIETGQRLLLLRQPATACALAWHPRGHRLAVASYGRQIHLWDAESGRRITAPWEGARHEGLHLAFSPAGDQVASTEWYSVLRLWDAATGQLLLSERGHWLLSYGSDDQALGFEGNRVVRVAGGQELRTLLRPTPDGPKRVEWTSLHPGGRLLAVQTAGGCGLWDLLTGEELSFLPMGLATREGVRFDATGALWTFGDAGLLRWAVRPADSPPAKLVIGPPEQVSNVSPRREHDGFACSSDGRVAVVALDDDGALLIHRGPPRRTFRLGPQYDVRHVRLTPDGRRAVTTSHFGDGSGVFTKLWDAATGTLVAELPAEVRWETLRGLSPDGHGLLYSEGKQAKRMEIASPAGQSWRGEPAPFGDAFSPDGSLRALGDAEGTIRLMAADAEKEIARLPSPEQGSVWPTGFSPDGALLLARGEESGALYVFDLRRIREQLAGLGLDWDAAPYPPRKPEEARPAVDNPLRAELIDAEWAASRRKMAEYERKKAVAALFVNPFDADAHYRLGCLLLEPGRFAEARAHLTAALAFRPDLDSAYLPRAEAARGLKRWDEAAADATRFLATCPYDTRALLLRAEVNRARKRPDESAADLGALIAAYPREPALYERRADCYQAMGQADRAAADRAKALQLGGNEPVRLNDRAWHLVAGPEAERDPARALELIQKAIEREPGNGQFLNTLGVAQYRNGQYAAAVATLEKSLAAGKGVSDGFDLFFLAMCHARLGDAKRAKDCFDRAARWAEAHKDLPPQYAGELRAFRAEAEATLRAR